MALIKAMQNFIYKLLLQYVTIINVLECYKIFKFDHEDFKKMDDPDNGIATFCLCSE